MKIDNNFEKVREYWNSRADLGQWAGSKDVIAKQLEIEAIASYVKDGMKILEIGCGNGITAIELAARFNVNVTAFDYAEEMITSARKYAEKATLKGSVNFAVGDVLSMPDYNNRFDLIYTERVLINLPDWEAQSRAVVDITSLLANGGCYVMCENSQEGLDNLNQLRECAGLDIISPPWHNEYFLDYKLAQLSIPEVVLETVNVYSSTYYFLSRVVNAALAVREGKDPAYDSEINQLALQLPSIGDCGQGRIWLWRRNEENM